MLRKIDHKKKFNWRKFFVIFVILLLLGVVIAVAIVNIDKIAILWKTP